MGSASEWIGLEGCTEVSFLVTQIGPSLVSSAVSHFTSGSDSSWFTHDSGLISPYQSRKMKNNIFLRYTHIRFYVEGILRDNVFLFVIVYDSYGR